MDTIRLTNILIFRYFILIKLLFKIKFQIIIQNKISNIYLKFTYTNYGFSNAAIRAVNVVTFVINV